MIYANAEAADGSRELWWARPGLTEDLYLGELAPCIDGVGYFPDSPYGLPPAILLEIVNLQRTLERALVPPILTERELNELHGV